MKKIYTLLFLCLLCLADVQSFGQNFIYGEKTTESYSNYFDQIHMLQLSLKERKLRPLLVFSEKFRLSDEAFNLLCDKFQRNYPQDFKGPMPLLEKNLKRVKEYYMSWTYSRINPDKSIDSFLQLVVYYEVDETGDAIKYPKIAGIEINEKGTFPPLDKKEMLKLYKEREERDKKNPLPPPPSTPNH